MNTLIDVLVCDENDQEDTLLAKIIDETDTTYKIRYLVKSGSGLYRYEKSITEIEKDAVCGFYDTGDERVAGFVEVEGGFQPVEEADEDYEPSESESDDESEDESLADSEDFLEEC